MIKDNRKPKNLRYSLIMAGAALSSLQMTAARPWSPDQIPNGRVFGCATCHNTDGSRNAFGLAVQARVTPGSHDSFWGPELAALDSDGDGFTNGEELGDPDGDGVPTPGAQITQPGNRSSKPSPLTISPPTAPHSALRLTWNNGTPPFLVQQRVPTTGAEWTDILTTDARSVVLPRDAAAAFLRVQSNTGKAITPFTVWLSGAGGSPESISSPATGFGTLALEGPLLKVRIRFSGLSAKASVAQIEGPEATADGAAFVLPLTGVANEATGVIQSSIDVSGLSAEQIAAIKQGRASISIQTTNSRGGEIRGRVAPMQLQSSLTGAAAQPEPIMSTGTGSGQFWLIGNELSYEVTYANLSGAAIAAHLHGPADVYASAGVVVALQPTAGVLGIAGAFSGTVSLTPAELGQFLDGLTYVTIESSNYPDGELRGQVIPYSPKTPPVSQCFAIVVTEPEHAANRLRQRI